MREVRYSTGRLERLAAIERAREHVCAVRMYAAVAATEESDGSSIPIERVRSEVPNH